MCVVPVLRGPPGPIAFRDSWPLSCKALRPAVRAVMAAEQACSQLVTMHRAELRHGMRARGSRLARGTRSPLSRGPREGGSRRPRCSRGTCALGLDPRAASLRGSGVTPCRLHHRLPPQVPAEDSAGIQLTESGYAHCQLGSISSSRWGPKETPPGKSFAVTWRRLTRGHPHRQHQDRRHREGRHDGQGDLLDAKPDESVEFETAPDITLPARVSVHADAPDPHQEPFVVSRKSACASWTTGAAWCLSSPRRVLSSTINTGPTPAGDRASRKGGGLLVFLVRTSSAAPAVAGVGTAPRNAPAENVNIGARKP